MFWRSKRKKAMPIPQQLAHDTFDDETDDEAEQDAEISAALQLYQEEFAERLKAEPNLAAERAREVVARAYTVVSESGLGRALAPRLLEHVIHWPSWSKRDDFDKWKGFPAEAVRGSDDGTSDKCVVHFTYCGRAYTLRFAEESRSWGDSSDCRIYGKVQLLSEERAVLGLDAVKDLAKLDAARWTWCNVFAFVPGPWMKDLIEIAAHIEHSEAARWQQLSDECAIDQGANIALSPDD